jgi:hypothetical protein
MDNTLIGKYLVRMDEDDCFSVDRIGKVIGQVNADHFLVQFYSDHIASDGFKEADMLTPFNDVEIISLSEIKKWRIFISFGHLADVHVKRCPDCKRLALYRVPVSNNVSKKRVCSDCAFGHSRCEQAASVTPPAPFNRSAWAK